MMDSTPVISHSRPIENIENSFDTVISGIKRSKCEYQEKAKGNYNILEKLGFQFDDVPENIKRNIKDIFNDNEVFNYNCDGSRQSVTINGCHLLHSLEIVEQMLELELVKREADSVLRRVENLNFVLKRKLNITENQSRELQEKANEKIIQNMVFKNTLEKAEQELKSLQCLSDKLEKLKFSHDEIKHLKEEENKLEEEKAILNAKLAKYHNLPLDETAASKKLERLKEELVRVDEEIKSKVLK